MRGRSDSGKGGIQAARAKLVSGSAYVNKNSGYAESSESVASTE